MKHRKDVQSLRALAILLVVAAHARVPWLQGGYIGVDVFFVLSGYLISGLILQEVDTHRRFDAWGFYAKRLKRLLPALLLVLLSVALVAWVLASPAQQGVDAQAGQAAAVWASNFYFAARVINYFSGSVNSNVWLHTWSLGVEEQFYVVWPWLLLFAYGVWNWQGALYGRKRLAVGLALTIVISLALGTYWAYTSPEAAFYLMPGRMWEFALGGLVLLLRQALAQGRWALIRRLQGRSLLNTTGWFVILGAAVGYADNLRYPGLWALVPALGACLVLLDTPETAPERAVSRLMLKEPVLQFIGNISYSLYLWHWPVLVLGGQILGREWPHELLLVTLSVLLATLTYYALENPLRRLRVAKPRNIGIPALLGITLAFVGMGRWTQGVATLLQSPVQHGIEMSLLDTPFLYRDPRGCDTWHYSTALSPCTYGPVGAAHTAVLFGDSVLAQWFPAVADIYLSRPNWRLVVLTKSACPASEVHFYYSRIHAPYTVCDIWRRRAVRYIAGLHPDVLIMGSAHYPFTSKQWTDGTQRVLDQLSPASQSVVLLSPTPALPFDGPGCLSAAAHWPHWLPLPTRLKCEAALAPATPQSLRTLLRRVARRYPNVHVIDPGPYVCPDHICRAQYQHFIVYRDRQHITASFAGFLAPELNAALGRTAQFGTAP